MVSFHYLIRYTTTVTRTHQFRMMKNILMRTETRQSSENIKSTTLIKFTLAGSVGRFGRNKYNKKRRSFYLLFVFYNSMQYILAKKYLQFFGEILFISSIDSSNSTTIFLSKFLRSPVSSLTLTYSFSSIL